MKPGFLVLILTLSVSMLGSTSQAFANDPIPECRAAGQALPITNDQVLQWKQTTQNQFKSRARIKGVLTKIYSDKTGHDHLQVQIGQRPSDTIEVIYNQEFGHTPAVIALGVQVEACGDYITATARAGNYPPSPDGAIIHWIHRAPEGRHEHGYLVIDGILYGQDVGNAGPKRRHGRGNRGGNPENQTPRDPRFFDQFDQIGRSMNNGTN